jgi:hypothetical protein
LKNTYPQLNNNVFSGKQKYSYGFIFIPLDKATNEELQTRVNLIKKSTLIKYGFNNK